MSNQPEDVVHLSPEVESQLNQRLAAWADARRLRSDDLEAIRGLVLARVSEPLSSAVESDQAFDAEWLWSLLRPVTSLIERTADAGEGNLSDRVGRWLQPLTGDRAHQPYLRLT